MSRTAIGIATTVLACLTVTLPGRAATVVKTPGEHPHYSVELEPHLVLDWAGAPGPDDEGFGAGLRASIPLFHNGPISTINNNMAITFGFDWSRGSHHCGPWRDPRHAWVEDCDIDSFWFPVALQWNFFLTDVISVFGEPGLAIAHHRWDQGLGCWAPGYCDPDGHDTRIRPVFWAGARFMLSDTIGITVRLGTPSVTAGVSLLL